MQNFDKAYNHTMANEGGYANVKDDKGGETFKGVSRIKWPNWQGWVLIDKIKLAAPEWLGSDPHSPALANWIDSEAAKNTYIHRLVRAFYMEHFWDANKLGSMPEKIALELFDTGVNVGAGKAAEFLQEALNLCNSNQKLYPNIKVDGAIGKITLGTLAKADTSRIYITLNLLQAERYLNILRKNEKQEKFWGGWLKRITL